MNRKKLLRTGIVIGLAMGIYAGYLYEPAPFDRAAYELAKQIVRPQPKNVSYGDWLFGCRKPTDCPATR